MVTEVGSPLSAVDFSEGFAVEISENAVLCTVIAVRARV